MKWKYIPQTNVALRPFTYSSCNNFLPLLHLNLLHYCCLFVVSSHLVRLRSCGWNCVVCLLWSVSSYSEVVSSMVDCYMGTSSNEWYKGYSSWNIFLPLLHCHCCCLFVVQDLSPRGWVCFVWLLWPVSCFSTSLLSIITSCVSKHIRRSRHCWLCVPTIPAVAVDCCVFVLHCWQYSHLSLIQGTVTCSMPAQQHYLSTQLTTVPLHLFSNMMIHVIVWMVGWLSYIAKVQRHLSLHTSSCASPRWRHRWPASFYLPSNQCVLHYLKFRIMVEIDFYPSCTLHHLLPTTLY